VTLLPSASTVIVNPTLVGGVLLLGISLQTLDYLLLIPCHGALLLDAGGTTASLLDFKGLFLFLF
jgi:hypothetical protein